MGRYEVCHEKDIWTKSLPQGLAQKITKFNTRHALSIHPKEDGEVEQREHIFRTRCHKNDKRLNDYGDVRVTEQVLVSFFIGKYKDEVICDVAPMHARHLLLGHP
ncbi:hypothetical protein CR513_58574, partial [Mucuna pruriens]